MSTKTAKTARKGNGKSASAAPSNMITLSEIAKSVKMEPRRARRILRNAEMSVEGQRWTFKKGSKDAARVEKLLRDADAE